MKPLMIVNERDRVNLTRVIYSNPLSNVTWYSNEDIIKVEHLTSDNMIAFYTIEEAQCSDTKNFTIMASNGLEKDAKALVELRVNCKYYCFICFEKAVNDIVCRKIKTLFR